MSSQTVLFVISLFLISFSNSLTVDLSSINDKKAQNVISFLSSESGFVIDDVLDLLKKLLNDEQKELKFLNETWPDIVELKNKTIQETINYIAETGLTCQNITTLINTIYEIINEKNKILTKYTERLEENRIRKENFYDVRCEQNQNYISELSANKHLLLLIKFLRQAIEQFSTTDFIEMNKNNYNKFVNYISFLAFTNHKYKHLLMEIIPNLPPIKERTDEEIGQGHLDNDKNSISVDKFDSKTIENLLSIKTKLLNLLKLLETNILEEIAKNQQNAIQADGSLADWEVLIEIENKWIKVQIQEIVKEIEKQYVLANDTSKLIEECKTKYENLQKTLETLITDLNNATDNYNKKVLKYQEIIDLFTKILHLYEAEVYSVNEEYKKRTDDYVEDQIFDKTVDFDKRELEKFYPMKGNVANEIAEEASKNMTPPSGSSETAGTLGSSGSRTTGVIF